MTPFILLIAPLYLMREDIKKIGEAFKNKQNAKAASSIFLIGPNWLVVLPLKVTVSLAMYVFATTKYSAVNGFIPTFFKLSKGPFFAFAKSNEEMASHVEDEQQPVTSRSSTLNTEGHSSKQTTAWTRGEVHRAAQEDAQTNTQGRNLTFTKR